MKYFNKPLLATTLIIATIAMIAPASAHSKDSRNRQAMSSQNHMMNQNRMVRQGSMRSSRMQHRQNHRLRKRGMTPHQNLEFSNPLAMDPELKQAFAD